jgi:hypothetical protein
MEVSANVRRTEPTPRREQGGETYSAATRSRSTSTQPIAAPSTATHTSCSRIARATRSAAPRVAQRSACSLDIAGTASARMARRRIRASAPSSAASARRICIKSLPRLTSDYPEPHNPASRHISQHISAGARRDKDESSPLGRGLSSSQRPGGAGYPDRDIAEHPQRLAGSRVGDTVWGRLTPDGPQWARSATGLTTSDSGD